MHPSPQQEHLTTQAFGVGSIVLTLFLISGIRPSEPLSVLPVVIIYAFLQALFRLGVRRAKRPIRARNFCFIA